MLPYMMEKKTKRFRLLQRKEPVIFGGFVGKAIHTISGFSPVIRDLPVTNMKMESGQGMMLQKNRQTLYPNMTIKCFEMIGN